MRPITASILAGAAAITAACTHQEARDAGPQGSRDVAVGNFTTIEAAGAYDVAVATGTKPSVRIEGPQNVIDELEVTVAGDELRIRPKKNHSFNWRQSSPVKISVTVPQLTGATLAGAGSLSVDKVSGDRFEATIAGAGDIDLPAIAVKTLDLDIAGAGSAKVAGQVERAKFTIAGSGDVEAPNLTARDIDLTVAGAGSLVAKATGTVTGSVLGSGDATITGGARCDVKKMGSGDVRCS